MNPTSSNGLAGVSSIGMQSQDFKVGDVIKLVAQGYGGFQPYFESNHLNPNDRLIEVTINSVKKLKPQEFLEA